LLGKGLQRCERRLGSLPSRKREGDGPPAGIEVAVADPLVTQVLSDVAFQRLETILDKSRRG
jgi:hypothetical protein